MLYQFLEFVIIVFLIIIVVRWFWNFMKRKAQNKMEDFIRQATGMPPREKGKKSSQRRYQDRTDEFYGQRNRYRSSRRNPDEPLIPKEYAEDVEFIESKDYSETDYTARTEKTKEHFHESQVSDAEWVEIKSGKESERKHR